MSNAFLLERLEAISRAASCGQMAEAHGMLAHLIRDVREESCRPQPCNPVPTPCPCHHLLDCLPPGSVVNFNIQTPCK